MVNKSEKCSYAHLWIEYMFLIRKHIYQNIYLRWCLRLFGGKQQLFIYNFFLPMFLLNEL